MRTVAQVTTDAWPSSSAFVPLPGPNQYHLLESKARKQSVCSHSSGGTESTALSANQCDNKLEVILWTPLPTSQVESHFQASDPL